MMIEKIPYIQDREFQHYIDIACGEGSFTKVVIESCKSIERVTGIELNASKKEGFLKSVEHKNLQFLSIDINDHIFEEDPIDCISLSLALHHIDGIESLLKRIIKLLAPQGLFIVHELINDNLSPAQQNQRDFHQLKARIDREHGEYHRNVYSLEEVQGMISGAGFTVLHDELKLNDTISDRDPDNLTRINTFVEEQVIQFYDGKKPDFLAEAQKKLLKNIEKHGFAPPPLYLAVCSV
jgi:ubiquinone/menaquinone biosynthesis C-methylase UbiE